MPDWPVDVLDFWFSLKPEQWWTVDPELDETVRERFGELWEEQSRLPVSHFLGSADEALAAIILFDQLPRNMFRGHADQFATDHLALAIAKAAVDRGYDERFEQPRRAFLYMPFEHSESLEDQEKGVELMRSLEAFEETRGLTQWAVRHRDIVARFGRFPHRNAVLGRASTPEEIAFLATPGSGF